MNKWEQIEQKWGTQSAVNRARSYVCSVVLGREFGVEANAYIAGHAGAQEAKKFLQSKGELNA